MAKGGRVHPCESVVRLDAETIRQAVRRFLDEDVGFGDVTTDYLVGKDLVARGHIVARESCVIAGMEIARVVFHQLDPYVVYTPNTQDGRRGAPGMPIVRLAGHAAAILTGERLALNLLQRLSGIATLTRQYADAIAGTPALVFDTRKTTPGLRLLEKYAVTVGGGRCHRSGLHDGILIKDNHIAMAGGVSAALARSKRERGQPVQIEVESLEQLQEALDGGTDGVLLDNMSPQVVAEAVNMVRNHLRGSACWIEASGGIAIENARDYACAGVDSISIGALTHSARAVDFSLEINVPCSD